MFLDIKSPPRRGARSRAARRRVILLRFGFVLLFLLIICALAYLHWFAPGAESALPSDSTRASTPSTAPSTTSQAYVAPSEPANSLPDADADTPPSPSYPAASMEIVPPLLGENYELSVDPIFDDAFFIGDSITAGLKLLDAFDQRPLLGNIGLTLRKAIDSIPEFVDYAPHKVFVLLGANDLTNQHLTEERYVEQYLELVQVLGQYFPEAIVYIQSILPVSNDYTGNELLTNARILSYNQALKEMADEHGIPFIDIGAAWRLPDNSLHPDVSDEDGLHILFRYYGSWLQILKDHAR